MISVVGAIGAGKSTLIGALPDYVTKLYESINMELLEAFYKDPVKNAFSFQLSVFDSHVDLVRNGLTEGTVVVERSMHCQKLFWKLQPKEAHEDFIYQKMWSKWRDLIPNPAYYVFLDTDDVKELLRRIKSRGRAGEDAVSADYEHNLIMEHKRFYTKERVGDRLIVLDALATTEQNVEKMKEILKL